MNLLNKKNTALNFQYFIIVVYSIALFVYAWYSSKNSTKNLENFEFRQPLFIFGVLLLSGSVFVVWLINHKTECIHILYLGMATIIFSLFLWSQPPVHGHDILFHYDCTYVLSNKILNQNTEEIKVGKGKLEEYARREGDKFRKYASFDNYILSYSDMQNGLAKSMSAEDAKIIYNNTYQREISVPMYFYFPQALGFSIARILGLNVFWLMLLGRLFICTACIIITYYAIKNMPMGKELFLVTSLTPTIMMSYASLSRDALILAVSYYFISKCLQLTYKKEERTLKNFVLLIIALILVVPYKLVYIPLAILLCLFPINLYREGILTKKHILVTAFIVTTVFIVFLGVNFKTLSRYATGNNVFSMGEDSPFTIPYVLSNLSLSLKVLCHTLLDSTVRFYANMIAIGDFGGGIHKEMVVVDTLFILYFLMISVLERKNKSFIKITGMERIVITLTWLAVSGMIFIGYLLCTPITSEVILGIQGRYFAPVLPLILLSFWGINIFIRDDFVDKIRSFLEKKRINKLVLLGVYGLSIFVTVNMYVWVVS